MVPPFALISFPLTGKKDPPMLQRASGTLDVGFPTQTAPVCFYPHQERHVTVF